MKKNISPTQKALDVWAIVLIIWAIYRANFHLPIWFDEFIAKPLIFIFPVYHYLTHIKGKKFFNEISLYKKDLKQKTIQGLIVGIVLLFTSLLALFFKGKNLLSLFSLPLKTIIYLTLISFAGAISEEILSRGFILKKLYQESKNTFSSVTIASVLFFFLHIPALFTNPAVSGNLLLIFIGTDFLLSLTVSFIFIAQDSLILPIFIHAFYNLAIALFI